MRIDAHEAITVPLTLGGIQTVQLLTETEADYGTYWQPQQFLAAHWNYTRLWELLVQVLPSSHVYNQWISNENSAHINFTLMKRF